jgi:two-component system OmpR family response regulator
MIKVLMIEDDLELAEILAEYLEQFDIEVETIDDPFLCVPTLSNNEYDLVILDLTLPGLDGLEVCKDIRKRYDIPIIISSARHDIDDKVNALEFGADDYMPKPYDPRELQARIKSLLRRKPDKTKLKPKEEKEKDIVYDEEKSLIFLKGEELNLTKAELGILRYMLKKEGGVISRDELIYNVDAISEDSTNKSIDVIVGRIRQKIGDNPKSPTYIHSVRGIGYKLVQ